MNFSFSFLFFLFEIWKLWKKILTKIRKKVKWKFKFFQFRLITKIIINCFFFFNQFLGRFVIIKYWYGNQTEDYYHWIDLLGLTEPTNRNWAGEDKVRFLIFEKEKKINFEKEKNSIWKMKKIQFEKWKNLIWKIQRLNQK